MTEQPGRGVDTPSEAIPVTGPDGAIPVTGPDGAIPVTGPPEAILVTGPPEAIPVTGPGEASPTPPVGREEVVDAYPVLAEVRPLPTTAPAALPAVQAAAAAATGFVAGAATIALCRRLGARRPRRRRIASPRPVDLPIVGTRTFLVDVHLIAKPGE